MKTFFLKVKGMHCKSCEMLVQDSLEEIGVGTEASHEKGEIKVTFDETKTSLNEIEKIIEKEGYRVA